MKNKVINYGVKYFERLEREHEARRWQSLKLWWSDNLPWMAASIILTAFGVLVLIVAFQIDFKGW